MKVPTMCPNRDCKYFGQSRKLIGGCECGSTLVKWHDPKVPTIEQIAYIVCDVSRLEGKSVPRAMIEAILAGDKDIHQQWLDRLKEIDWQRRLNEIHVMDYLG